MLILIPALITKTVLFVTCAARKYHALSMEFRPGVVSDRGTGLSVKRTDLTGSQTMSRATNARNAKVCPVS